MLITLKNVYYKAIQSFQNIVNITEHNICTVVISDEGNVICLQFCELDTLTVILLVDN